MIDESTPGIKRPSTLSLALTCLLTLEMLSLSSTSWADLGAGKTEPVSSGLRIQNQQLRAENSQYSVQELTLESGTLVKEYINSSGMVCGISWQGPFKPDLRLFLGEKAFHRMYPSTSQKPLDHHHSSINTSDLVIISRSEGRSFSGKAFLPLLTPENIRFDQIN
jgi:hypothetical protein